MNVLPLTRAAGAPPSVPDVPAPLSPDDFDGPAAVPTSSAFPAPAADGSVLTDSDIATLRQVRIVIREARTAVGSSDSKAVAAAGKRQVQVVVSYLLGFLDSRGLIDPQPVSPGFERLVGDAAQPTEDEVLDELEQALDQLLAVAASDPNTRGWMSSLGSMLSAVGDAAIAAGSALIGVALGTGCHHIR